MRRSCSSWFRRPALCRPALARQDGQISVLTVVFAVGLLAILALVSDAGLAFAARRDLQRTADAAARAGAGALDEAVYRASDGRTAQLEPVRARATAHQALAASGYRGQASITADLATVTVTLTDAFHPPVFGAFGLADTPMGARAVARPRTGIITPEAP